MVEFKPDKESRGGESREFQGRREVVDADMIEQKEAK